MNNEINIERLSRIFGDRVLIKRRGEPEVKRGILIPMSVRSKKEPKKIWWGELVAFGTESTAESIYGLSKGEVVGVEPIGNHYANWYASDGFEYCWVPDEHLALSDGGSVEDYYADKLDRSSDPRLRVLGRRVLARPVNDGDAVRGVIRAGSDEEAGAKLADVLLIGSSDIPVDVGSRVLHVNVDAGSSASVDIFDPPLLVLRVEDLIGESTPSEASKEVAHA